MKIKTFDNNEFAQIYVSKAENFKECENIKSQYLNVAVFVSGEDDTIKTIKEMLNYEKNALMD